MTSRLLVPPNSRVQSSSHVTLYMRSMSAFRVSRMCGRWTLTATSSPLCSVARWTWPIDAAANDWCSNVANTTSGSAPSSLADDLADLVVAERRDLVEQPEQLVAVRGPAGGRSAGPASGRASPTPRRDCSKARRRRTGPGRWSAPGRCRAGAMNRRKNTATTCQTRQRVPEQGPHAAVGRTLGRPSVRRCAATASDRAVSRRRRRTGRGRAGSAAPSLPPTRARP